MILQFCPERVGRWEWEREAEESLLFYLMIFSDSALFRLPLAYVLMTSEQSDGSVKPVELRPLHTCSQVSAPPPPRCCQSSLVNFRRVV